jgi:hypothetical protein
MLPSSSSGSHPLLAVLCKGHALTPAWRVLILLQQLGLGGQFIPTASAGAPDGIPGAGGPGGGPSGYDSLSPLSSQALPSLGGAQLGGAQLQDLPSLDLFGHRGES